MAPVEPSSTGEPKYEYEYEYRHSARDWDIATQVICIFVSTVCISMRMYSKFVLTRAPGWEDYTCVLAWIGLIAYAVMSFKADQHGSGVHQWEVEKSDLIEYAKIAYTSQIVYGPLIFITKLSILLLYLRIFTPATKSKTFFFIHLLIWGNLLFYLIGTLVKIFQCSPRAKAWDKSIPGHCLGVDVPILVAAAINVVSDCLILLLPMVSVWRLHMKMTRKLGVCAIFLAGSFGCISSVVRLVISVEALDTKDKTYDWFPQFLWTTAEITSAIIASCLPAFPTFFRHFSQKARTVLSKSSTGSPRSSDGNGTELKIRSVRGPSKRGSGPSATELLQTTNWEQEEFEVHNSGQGGGKSCLTGTIRTEVTSPILVDGERCSPKDIETGTWVIPRGILKTVEVDVASESGH